MRARRIRLPLTLAALILAAFSVDAGASTVADRVLEEIQQARAELGRQPLERDPELDAVASREARRIAGMPQARRLKYEARPGEALKEAGIGFRTVSVHIDSNLGYRDPADGFIRSWRADRGAWRSAIERGVKQIGIATEQGSDQWNVMTVYFVEPELTRAELPSRSELERAAVRAVAKERRKRGLGELRVNDELTRVARGHSEDMSLRGFFSHITPEGDGIGDRVKAAGIPFLRVGENLHMNRNFEDPIGKAVNAWLNSREHRGLMLSDDYIETGIGVAIDYRGAIFFTQVFLYPDRTRR